MVKHRRVPTLRGMAPLAFVLGTAIRFAGRVGDPAAHRLLLLRWSVNPSAASVFRIRSVRDRDGPMELLPALAAFSAFHVGCGSGQLVGWLRALGRLRQ